MNPLVSVMMPCYNSADSLPLALASLIAQTYENWECILIDDGSSDDPYAVVKVFNDPRIRYFRFNTNQGRAIARQAALDKANGDFLAMLDADDWYYPNKLRIQVSALVAEPQAIVAATGLVVVDYNNKIRGIRTLENGSAPNQLRGPVIKLAMPPFGHAPSLIRMEIAKSVSYRPDFKQTEDSDFMIKLILGRCYLVIPGAAYVYSEFASMSEEKILRGLYFRERMFRQYLAEYPLAILKHIAIIRAKGYVYRTLYRLGLGDWIIARRSRQPKPNEIQKFYEARKIVLNTLQNYFPKAFPDIK